MTIMVPIVLFGFIPLVLGLFALLPPRRAVIVAFLVGVLFLPMAEYKIGGFPSYSKLTAVGTVTFLAAAVFDGGRFLKFRPKWIDLPMLVWCLCPFASSFTNDLGFHDGISAVTLRVFIWGLPYLIGRIYFNDFESVRELAIGVFFGGIVYVLPCLFEIKMSPHLHLYIYGFDANWSMQEAKRFGGWRPILFMQHGLMLGAWMAAGSLVGVWLYVNGSVRKLLGVGMVWWLLVLVATSVLCKSTGALVIFAVGVLVLLVGRWAKTSVLLWCFVLVAPLYMGVRASGQWSGDGMVNAARAVAGDTRAASLSFRLRNEDPLAAHALQRPFFGWGGWGRNRLTDKEGDDFAVTDGLWIIVLGQNGLVGLTSMTFVLMLPGALLLRRYPGVSWSQPSVAPAAALAMAVTLFMIDCMMNGMLNPIYFLAIGSAGVFTNSEARRAAHLVPALKVQSGAEWKSNLGKYRLPPRVGET
jgi:hypothetical protein